MNRFIFISHSSKDEKEASMLCEFLEQKGEECFIAPRNIRYGREYAEEIVDGIDNSKAMVLMLSNNSNQSPHVLREVERAVSKSIPIIIYKLEDVELSKSMEYFLMTHQWLEAKKKNDYSEVLECINNIWNEEKNENLSEKADNKNDVQKQKNEMTENRNSKKVVFAIGAAVLVAVIILCIFISNKNNAAKPENNAQSDSLSGENTEEKTVETKEGENADNINDGKGAASIKVGDTVSFGKYNDEVIEWRVLKMSEDGKEATLVSKYILSMKAFDTAEGGKFNTDKEGNSYYSENSEADTNQELQVFVRGNGDWSLSNIRTWLNSEDEVVKYEDQAPIQSAMSELKNGYDNEPGFLYNFTKEERDAIKKVTNKTAGNKLSGKEIIETEDKVYLLSTEELKWFEEAGISVLAQPSQAALKQDNCDWYSALSEPYSVKEYYWWLRNPVEGFSSKCYIVGNGYLEENIFNRNVGLEGFGIRPAITVDIEKLP